MLYIQLYSQNRKSYRQIENTMSIYKDMAWRQEQATDM